MTTTTAERVKAIQTFRLKNQESPVATVRESRTKPGRNVAANNESRSCESRSSRRLSTGFTLNDEKKNRALTFENVVVCIYIRKSILLSRLLFSVPRGIRFLSKIERKEIVFDS